MTRTLIAIVLAATATGVGANPPASVRRLDGSRIAGADIDATVMRLMRAAEVTGVGIALLNAGRAVYLNTYGVRDKEKNLPLTPRSVMTSASFSKAAFAYMVMQLVDERVIELDTPVQQYLPKPLSDYPGYESLAGDARRKRITSRMLLDHTSGFANLRAFEPDRQTHIHFEPGSRYAYSGQGIQLLQLVVETVTHRPLEDLMRDRVFVPFAMTRSSMVWQDRFENDYANGYDEYGRSLGPERRHTADAAGSMQTTLADFTRFLEAVIRGERLRPETRRLTLSQQIAITSKHQFPTLAPETTDENRPIHLGYGLGWGLYQSPYGTAFFKEGHDEGWRHYTVTFEQPRNGIVIMTNSSNGEGIFKELLETLQRNTFTPIEWEGFTPYDRLPPRPPLPEHHLARIDPKLLERYAGRYQFSPDIILIVRRAGDHLSVQENDETPQELFPESERDFFSRVSDDVFSFEVDATGQVTRMILHTGGREVPIKRIE